MLKKRLNEESLTAYLMLLPSFIMLTIFVVIPLILAFHRSFFDYRVYDEVQKFVGFDNFIYVLKNEVFVKSVINVTIFTLIITVATIVISFLFAHVIKQLNKRLGSTVRIIIYLPFLLSGVVVSVIFTLLTTFNGGLINELLKIINLNPIPFDNSAFWAPISIIVPTIWIGFGYNTLVMYAGLINIPKEYYEAASIDGANALDKLFRITIPNMKNYFVLLTVGLVTINLQMFDIPMMMTNGAPANKTMTPVLYLIHSRSNGNISDSQILAAALLVMVVIVTINSLVFKTLKSSKSMDA